MTGWTAAFYDAELGLDRDVPDATRRVLMAMAEPPWPAVTGWRAPYEDEEELRTDSFLDFLSSATPRSAEWNHGRTISGLAIKRPGRAVISLQLKSTAVGSAWRWIVAFEELVLRLRDGGAGLAWARLRRSGGGAAWLPELPAIGDTTHLFAGPREWLADGWDDVDAALTTGGWHVEEDGDLLVLTRAMHAETNVEFLEATVDGHWAMARLARPGRCRYNIEEEPVENEWSIFRRGERRLFAVGHDPDERVAVFSCAIDADQHVQPWEVWTLGQALERRHMPSGEPVDAIRVIFADRGSAMRERTPLIDVGVTVQYYDETATIVTLAAE